MSYRRRRYKKKRGRTGRYLSYGKSAAGIAYLALKTANSMKALLNTEWKYSDTTAAGNASSPGLIVPFSYLAQGSGGNMRNGTSVMPKKLSIKIKNTINAAATNTFVRFILFRDKEFNRALPSVDDLLESADYNSFYKLDDASRFFVFKDVTIGMTQTKSYQMMNFSINMNRPKSGKKRWEHLKYNGAAASAANSENGQLLLLIITNEATNRPAYEIEGRLRYIDN